MRSQLFSQEFLEQSSPDSFALQNPKMLKVRVQGGTVMARQGTMVAFQGDVRFDYQSAGGLGKIIKKAVTGEGLDVMSCTGNGDVFFADQAADVHVFDLDGTDGLSVNGVNVLAFEPQLKWDIKMIGGAGMIGGGLFNTIFTGTGKVAITTKGTPVVLQVDAPTFVDTDAVVAWSASLQTSIRTGGFKPGALLGRASGEAYQLGFSGQGFVIVQPSENPPRAAGAGGGGAAGGIGGMLGRLGS